MQGADSSKKCRWGNLASRVAHFAQQAVMRASPVNEIVLRFKLHQNLILG